MKSQAAAARLPGRNAGCLRSCLAGLLILLMPLAGTALATTFVKLPLELMLDKAELAVHGTVSSIRAELRDDEPWTDVTFGIIRDFLAAAAAETPEEITLSFLGGSRPDGTNVTVELMPQFSEGEEVLLLAYAADYYSPIVGFNQAVWWLQPDGQWQDMSALSLGVDEVTGSLQQGAGGSRDQVLAALALELADR
jgi:hypothetical protein